MEQPQGFVVKAAQRFQYGEVFGGADTALNQGGVNISAVFHQLSEVVDAAFRFQNAEVDIALLEVVGIPESEHVVGTALAAGGDDDILRRGRTDKLIGGDKPGEDDQER
jgi:hypothetical protein